MKIKSAHMQLMHASSTMPNRARTELALMELIRLHSKARYMLGVDISSDHLRRADTAWSQIAGSTRSDFISRDGSQSRDSSQQSSPSTGSLRQRRLRFPQQKNICWIIYSFVSVGFARNASKFPHEGF